jgi:flagellar biosynthesis/type III secretory pathway M-ring protein FliF/YscJ
MQTKQLSSKEIEELKIEVMKANLKRIFKKKPKAIAKILSYLIKRHKNA